MFTATADVSVGRAGHEYDFRGAQVGHILLRKSYESYDVRGRAAISEASCHEEYARAICWGRLIRGELAPRGSQGGHMTGPDQARGVTKAHPLTIHHNRWWPGVSLSHHNVSLCVAISAMLTARRYLCRETGLVV